MTLSKSTITLGSLMFAALFGGGIFLAMNIGSVAQRVTERLATDTLGVQVSMSALELSLQEKTATVSGLTIANPPGFEKPYAIRVETIKIVLSGISERLIEFKDIDVQGTTVNLEVKEGTTNLQTIKKNLKSTPASEQSQDQMKVIIDRAAVRNAQLRPTVTLVTEQELSPVNAPDILLTGIGRKEQGVLVQEAIAQVLGSVIRTLNETAGRQGFLKGLSADSLKDMGVSQIDQIKGRIDQEIDSVTDSVKGLFGN